MLARNVMSTLVISVASDASVSEAAEILAAAHISALPVVNGEGKIIGIVS